MIGLGYVSPTVPPDCSATFTFRLTRIENTPTTRAMDEIKFHCRRKAPHEGEHLGDFDFPKLSKRVTITWGDGFGKPRIIETPLSISQSPAVE